MKPTGKPYKIDLRLRSESWGPAAYARPSSGDPLSHLYLILYFKNQFTNNIKHYHLCILCFIGSTKSLLWGTTVFTWKLEGSASDAPGPCQHLASSTLFKWEHAHAAAMYVPVASGQWPAFAWRSSELKTTQESGLQTIHDSNPLIRD